MILYEALETALALFQEKPNAEPDEIMKDLTAAGIDAEQAARLVCFIPVALCRLVFGAAGVQFAPYYITIDEAENETGAASFTDDPVYVEAYARCAGLLTEGEQAEQVRPLAARSADYKAIMELHLQQGLALNQMALPPPRLNLPPGREPQQKPGEEESEPTSEQMPAEAKEYLDVVKSHFDHPFVKQLFYELTLLEWNVPEKGAVSFWAIQFRDNANGALVWKDSGEKWRIGKWMRFAGKERPLQVDLGYFQDCPPAPSFQEALSLLEAGRGQQASNKSSWSTRLWKRSAG